MNETNAAPLPARSFYTVAAAGLLWNMLGIAAYLGQVTLSPERLAAMPEAERALFADVPAWATGAFAVAVFAGALGCVLLAARRALAFPILILSLVALLAQQFHGLFLSEALAVLGPSALALPAGTLLLSVFLVWYSGRAAARGWIR